MGVSRILTALLAGALFTAGAFAQDCQDAPGAQDHPLLPRYQDACLLAASSVAFNRFELPLGKPKRDGDRWTTDPVESLEGAHTRLLYAAPEGRSALEVMGNYQQGLQARGYEILFQCADADCGGRNQLLNNVLFPTQTRRQLGGDRAYYVFSGSDQTHQLSARKTDGSAYVSVYVGTSNFKSSPTAALMGRAIVLADVIEPQAMELRMVDAEEMARSIQATGRVALNNVYFEFGAAALTAESAPAIGEMTKLLQNDEALSVFVVGHTDSLGDYAVNLRLSQQRAEAVVAALAGKGIDASRLTAVGIASVSPLASNRSEQGRAENRRVELVER